VREESAVGTPPDGAQRCGTAPADIWRTLISTSTTQSLIHPLRRTPPPTRRGLSHPGGSGIALLQQAFHSPTICAGFDPPDINSMPTFWRASRVAGVPGQVSQSGNGSKRWGPNDSTLLHAFVQPVSFPVDRSWSANINSTIERRQIFGESVPHPSFTFASFTSPTDRAP